MATPPTPASGATPAAATPRSTTASKRTAKSSFILTPLMDGWDAANVATFPEIETPVGRLSISAQFQPKDKHIGASIVLRRDPADNVTKASRLPVRCAVTLSVTARNSREQSLITAPQVFALDKDQPVTTYIAIFPFTALPSTTIVYEAQVVLAPLSTSETSAPHLYLATIDQPHFSDCVLLAKQPNNLDSKSSFSHAIYVSKAILAARSPFFATMFTGNWRESLPPSDKIDNDKPVIALGEWPMVAVIPCVIFMYCGWLPGTTLPKADALHVLLTKHKWNVTKLTRHDWNVVMDLAEMLELAAMCWAVKKVVVKMLARECDEHFAEVILVEQPVAADGGASA